MKKYSLVYSQISERRVFNCSLYIAETTGYPDVARRWLDSMYDRIDTLCHFPYRHEIAEESEYRDYEIRRMILGNYIALYMVNEETRTVHVLTVRHGSQLPDIDELPDSSPDELDS